MAGLPKIKLQKTTYNFDIKKKYSYEKRYKIVQKPPLEILKNYLYSFFKTTKEEKKTSGLKKEKQPPTFNPIIIGGAFLVAFLLIFSLWMWLNLRSMEQVPSTTVPILEIPTIQNTLFDGMIITSGDRLAPMSVASFGLNYNASGLDTYKATVFTYQKNIYSEVFILKSDVEDADIYPYFVSSLRTELKKIGLNLNEISIQELETIPGGSVVIIPSGYLPIELIGGSGSTVTPEGLAARGVVVLYVGKPFSRVYSNGIVINTPTELKKNIPFNFEEKTSLRSEGIHLYQPLYSVSAPAWMSDIYYGSVSVLTKGDGAFVFIPQTLSSGWQIDPQNPSIPSYQYAAEDVTKILLDMPWATPTNPEGKVYILEPKADATYLLTKEFKGNEQSILVFFYGEKKIGDQTLSVVDRKVIRVSNNINGKMFIFGGNNVIPTSISGRSIRVSVLLAEPQAQQLNLKLIILNSSGDIFTEVPIGKISTQSEKDIDLNIDPPSGEYVLVVVDESGKQYAASYLTVTSLKIVYKGRGASPSSYVFSITMNGNPTQLNQVIVSVDEGKYGRFTYNSVFSNIEVNVGDYTGNNALPPGNHTFEFTVGKLVEKYHINVPVPSIPLFGDPLFLGGVILAILIVGVGIVFARKEDVTFSIDIPDFPPLTREKISVSTDVVLSIFEKVNANYQWKFTPLLLQEIKSGFKEIHYKGNPIYITDYNTEIILDKMSKQGKIVKILNYYAPKIWEEKSQRSIVYLSMLRALRDICINNAVPFTGLNESKVADSEIDVMGQKMFVHFYYENIDVASLLKKILLNVKDGINIVLFENEVKKNKFKKLLKSPSFIQTILKMEAESNNIQLLTITELEKMIKELRTI
ncbi:MAG: hypothetical protein QW255_02550 [Candidatus Bilamarchaeaceae archaeon]